MYRVIIHYYKTKSIYHDNDFPLTSSINISWYRTYRLLKYLSYCFIWNETFVKLKILYLKWNFSIIYRNVWGLTYIHLIETVHYYSWLYHVEPKFNWFILFCKIAKNFAIYFGLFLILTLIAVTPTTCKLDWHTYNSNLIAINKFCF